MVEVLRDLINGAEMYSQRFRDFLILHRKDFNGDIGDNVNPVISDDRVTSTTNGSMAAISTTIGASRTESKEVVSRTETGADTFRGATGGVNSAPGSFDFSSQSFVLYTKTDDATLNAVNEFARLIVQRGSRLLRELEPLFDKLSNTSDEDMDRAIKALASRYNRSSKRIEELVGLFLKLTGVKRDDLQFDYERVILSRDPGPLFTENRRKLLDDGLISQIDRTLIRSADPINLMDVRELLSRTDIELAVLQRYFQQQSGTEVTLFDILFRPKVTVDYVPRVIGLLLLRQIGLDDLAEFFDWARVRSLELRNDAHEENERMNNELKRLNFTRKQIEDDLLLSTVREKPYYEEYLRLVRLKHETTQRLRDLNRHQLRVESAIRYLGNTTRMADYYTLLEYNYLVNLSSDDFNEFNTDTIVDTEAVDAVQVVSPDDANTLLSVTNAYRDYRDVLLNFMKLISFQDKNKV